MQRQAQYKAGAAAGVVFTVHAAVVPAGNRAHQGQAQADATGALAGAGQAVERFEDAFALVRRYTGAPVADAHFGHGAHAAYDDSDLAVAVAPRVFQQVAHGAAQQLGDARHLQCIGTGVGVQVGIHAGAFLGRKAHQVHGFDGAHVGLMGV